MLRRMLPCHGRDWSCFLGFGIIGRRVLVRFVAAVKDVVELRDWIAAFDADGHATSMVALLDETQFRVPIWPTTMAQE